MPCNYIICRTCYIVELSDEKFQPIIVKKKEKKEPIEEEDDHDEVDLCRNGAEKD